MTSGLADGGVAHTSSSSSSTAVVVVLVVVSGVCKADCGGDYLHCGGGVGDGGVGPCAEAHCHTPPLAREAFVRILLYVHVSPSKWNI